MLVFTIRVIFRDCSGYWRSRTSGVPRGRPHGRGNHILLTKAKIQISTKHRIRGNIHDNDDQKCWIWERTEAESYSYK
jgi:hypothetical protein